MPKTPNPDSGDNEALSAAGAAGLRAMRALEYETCSLASEDVIAFWAERVLLPLGEILSATDNAAVGRELLAAAGKLNKKLNASYAGMKPNARGQGSGGLADNPVLLQSFVEMEAESMELENWKDAEVNDEVLEVARDYDAALMKALEELVKAHPPENEASAEDLWAAEAPFLVLMTLRGEGVGIWDGDWSRFYEDTDEAEEFLKKKLGKFADGSGAGLFAEACMSAATESCGDPDEDDDESDDEDDDEDD